MGIRVVLLSPVIGKIFFSCCFSFLATFYLIPLFSIIARRFKFLDRPDGNLKKHQVAVPCLGGVALFGGFLITIMRLPSVFNQFSLVLAGAAMLLLVGFLDDAIRMGPLQKLLGQLLATLCFLRAGLYLKASFFFNFWNIAISVLWILTVINAFNLVDVMDGLASILALGVASTFFVIAIFLKMYNAAYLLAAFIGSLLAFFYYNKPDAKIYLGDAGALCIGGFLAVIPFLFSWHIYNWLGCFSPFIIFGLPLLEIIGLIVIRTFKRIPFFRGSPDHFSLYLLSYGWGKVSILWYVSILSLLLMLAAILFFFNRVSFGEIAVMAFFFTVNWFLVLKNIS